MKVLDGIKYLMFDEIYFIISIVYLFRLNEVNKELLQMGFSNAIGLLIYNEYMALKFFVLALILFLIGLLLGKHRVSNILWVRRSFGEIVLNIFSTVIIVILVIALMVFINNPIMRAVMSVALLGVAICTAIK